MSLGEEKYKCLKNNFNSDELRERRFEVNLQLRKKRRNDDASKRRDVNTQRDYEELLDDIEMLDITQKKRCLILPDVVKLLFCDNVYNQIAAVQKVSRLLWQKPAEVIDDIAKLGLLPHFVQMLQSGEKVLQVSQIVALSGLQPLLQSSTFLASSFCCAQ